MRLLPIHPFSLATFFDPTAAPHLPRAGSIEADHNVDLLQRTPNDHTEAPDPRFWTSYDYVMVEREARAQRRAYVYRLIARAWRNLQRRLRDWRGSSGTTPTEG